VEVGVLAVVAVWLAVGPAVELLLELEPHAVSASAQTRTMRALILM
jgi:hypothetical protein